MFLAHLTIIFAPRYTRHASALVPRISFRLFSTVNSFSEETLHFDRLPADEYTPEEVAAIRSSEQLCHDIRNVSEMWEMVPTTFFLARLLRPNFCLERPIQDLFVRREVQGDSLLCWPLKVREEHFRVVSPELHRLVTEFNSNYVNNYNFLLLDKVFHMPGLPQDTSFSVEGDFTRYAYPTHSPDDDFNRDAPYLTINYRVVDASFIASRGLPMEESSSEGVLCGGISNFLLDVCQQFRYALDSENFLSALFNLGAIFIGQSSGNTLSISPVESSVSAFGFYKLLSQYMKETDFKNASSEVRQRFRSLYRRLLNQITVAGLSVILLSPENWADVSKISYIWRSLSLARCEQSSAAYLGLGALRMSIKDGTTGQLVEVYLQFKPSWSVFRFHFFTTLVQGFLVPLGVVVPASFQDHVTKQGTVVRVMDQFSVVCPPGFNCEAFPLLADYLFQEASVQKRLIAQGRGAFASALDLSFSPNIDLDCYQYSEKSPKRGVPYMRLQYGLLQDSFSRFRPAHLMFLP